MRQGRNTTSGAASAVIVKAAGSVEDAAARYGLGRDLMMETAKQAGAVCKIGRRTIINFALVDEYLNQIAE